MLFGRKLDPLRENRSVFLFGPRMTGKTTLLGTLGAERYFDLLDPELELQYRSRPRLFWEQIAAVPEQATIIVDEVQRVPDLLDYVQMGIDRRRQIFLLSGSSARKLRRGGANFLGGRALELHLHAFSSEELGSHFDLNAALNLGTLPLIASLWVERRSDAARAHLKSYLTTYIREEIQAEALTRNVDAFRRFLDIAGQDNAQVIEFSNIARESGVLASTVKLYYQILEDTFLGFLLQPYGHSERKKARPKFYFFDCGVVRAIQHRLVDKPTPSETGFLFETWFVNELRRIRDYEDKDLSLAFWRDRNHEIDILVTKGRQILLAIECKAGATFDKTSIRAFRKRFPDIPICVASMRDTVPRIVEDTEVLPWSEVLERFRSL